MDISEVVDLALRGKRVFQDDLLRKADETGWSVAHELSVRRKLPVDFVDWDIADNTGYTVAHSAAFLGTLPESFDHFHLADENGSTIAHILARRLDWERLSRVPKEVLSMRNSQGKTPVDVIKQIGNAEIDRLKKLLGE